MNMYFNIGIIVKTQFCGKLLLENFSTNLWDELQIQQCKISYLETFNVNMKQIGQKSVTL